MRTARARPVVGTVLNHPAPDLLTVFLTDAGQRVEFDIPVTAVAGYPVDTTVTVLLDENGIPWRLASQGYRPNGLAVLVVGVGLAGLVLLGRVLHWRRGLARLSAGPVLVLRVRVRPNAALDPVVYAADDERGERALLVVRAVLVDAPDEEGAPAADEQPDEDADKDKDGDGDGDAADRDRRDPLAPELIARMRQTDPAILYGLPRDGAALAVRYPDASWYLGPRAAAGPPRRVEVPAAVRLADQRTEARRSLGVSTEPRVWRPKLVTRLLSGLFMVVLLLPAAVVWRTRRVDLLLLGCVAITAVVVLGLYDGLYARIATDAHRVTVVEPTSIRTLGWDEIEIVEPFDDRLTIHALDPKQSIPVGNLRGAVRPDRARRIAADLNAMLADPALRPHGEYRPPVAGTARLVVLYGAYLAVTLVAVVLASWH